MQKTYQGVVLASASPRRKELLENVGIFAKILVSNIVEERKQGELPAAYAARNAFEKAQAVTHRFPKECEGRVVVGCDTIVVTSQNIILEKPKDTADAIDMLQSLSGTSHFVLSGLALLGGQSGLPLFQTVVSTQVTFRPLLKSEIEAYVGTGEPMDKAGGYGAQGKASAFIQEIKGSYTNVVGLPLTETCLALRDLAGIEIFSTPQD